ncbi:hypothetical protein L596_002679 [Steinernema carpocapsae]|uniref:Saposin B-type domain-containing protein n=1 Tax=Steinernema carpocapsae TaxID=34508 RepID=A0A4U8UQF5_STECR|nr:hypothetical protein L596_002679 [Steinernema carpocapsae]
MIRSRTVRPTSVIILSFTYSPFHNIFSPFAMLFASIFFLLLTTTKAEQEANETLTEDTFLPPDLLCPLCQAVIDGYKKQLEANFKKDLLESCEKLSKDSKDQLLICQDRITDINVNKLRDETTKEICLEQEFCLPDDYITTFIFENTPPENMTIETIPDVPSAKQTKSKTDQLQSTSASSNSAILQVSLALSLLVVLLHCLL